MAIGGSHFVRMAKMTDKQEKFAFLVGAEGKGLSEAYRLAFNAGKMTDKAVHVEATRLSQRPNVALRIQALRDSKRATAELSMDFNVKKLMETYLAIAFVDPNELISTKVGACRHCWGVGGGFQWKEHEYLGAVAAWERKPDGQPMPDPAGGFGYRFTREPNPECVKCEGEGLPRLVPKDTTKLSPGARLLYKGVQQTKEGLKILFRDQDKALDQIGRMLGAFDDKLRVDLSGKVASLKLMTNDPKEAAEAYQKMIAGQPT